MNEKINFDKLEVLVEGNEFKDFKTMARFLDIRYTGTSTCSIAAIKRELRRYFEWERVGSGRVVRITKIYAVPIKKKIRYDTCDEKNAVIATGLLTAKNNIRFTSRGEESDNEDAAKYIAELQNTEDYIEKIVITRKELLSVLNMTANSNLSEDVINSLVDNKDISIAKVHKTAYDELQNALSTIIKGALKSLQHKFLLEYYPGDIIVRRGKYVVATKEEQRLLNIAKDQTLKKMKMLSAKHVYAANRYREYAKGVINNLPKELHIIDFQPAYLVVFTPKQLKKYIVQHLGIIPSIEDAKALLFEIIKNSLYESNFKTYANRMMEDNAVLPEIKEQFYINYLQ